MTIVAPSQLSRSSAISKQASSQPVAGGTKTFAFVTLELYPTTVGGTGILLHHTITALLAAGNRVVLYLDLAPHEISKFDQQDRHGYPNPHLLEFYDVHAMRQALGYCERMYEDKEQWRSVSFAHAILKTQDRHQIDLIEFYDYCGPAYHYLSFATARRCPVAIRLHNTTEIIERGTRAAFNKSRLYTFAMERAQLVLAELMLSPGEHYFRQEVLKLYPLEMKSQVVATAPPIHSSIGEVVYSLATRKILFYGRLSTFKGLDTFINGAVLALRDELFRAWVKEFVIVGPEETVASSLTLEEIRSIIPTKLAHKFNFVGRVTHPQLMKILTSVSFACFANRMESFCYAAHELHTAGIPLVIADRPAFKDHFTDEEVVFFDGSAYGLGAAMTELAANPDRRTALSQRSRHVVPYDGAALYHRFAEQALQRKNCFEKSASRAAAGVLLSVFVLSSGDLAAERATIESLQSEGISVHVLRLKSDGMIMFSGLGWVLQAGSDLLGLVGTACIFVRAGDLCRHAALLEMAEQIASDDRIGAIAPWCENDGQVLWAPHAFIPEYAAFTGPGLRSLIRVDGTQTVLELMRSGSFTDETSLLLAQRAMSRAIVERPEVGVAIDGAVVLPAARTDVAVDYDRMSPMYLALCRDIGLSAADGARQLNRQAGRVDGRYALLSIRATDTFGEGEVWLLRVFHMRGAMHEPWSILQQTGEWTTVQESHSPAGGALKTYHGEASFWADNDFGIEFLWGPFCGCAEIKYRDSIYQVKLRNPNVSSSIVWISDLIRGLTQIPVPERLPVTVIGSCALGPQARAWIEGNINPRVTEFLLTEARVEAEDARSDTVVVSPSDLLEGGISSPADLARALVEAIRQAGPCTLHLPFGFPDGPQIAALILQAGVARINLDIDDRSIRTVNHTVYRELARWTGMLAADARGFTVTGSNDDLIFPLEMTGAKVRRSAGRLPYCPPRPEVWRDEVDIVLLRSDGMIDNISHMVAGAAFLTMLGIRASTLYVEDGQWHAASLSETLSAARACVSYKSLDRVIGLHRSRQLIACAIYPDPVIPRQALQALASGILTVVGPVGLSRAHCSALGPMSVVYWEDAREIGNALAEVVRNGAALTERYNQAVDAMTKQSAKQRRSSKLIIDRYEKATDGVPQAIYTAEI